MDAIMSLTARNLAVSGALRTDKMETAHLQKPDEPLKPIQEDYEPEKRKKGIPADAMLKLAARSASVSGVQKTERTEATRAQSSAGYRKPVRDEYVPEEKRKESYGRYWLERGEEGNPKIRFDGPEAEEAPEMKAVLEGEDPEAPKDPAEAPKKADPSGKGRKEEKCTGNTDAVDREIKKLKEKKEKLEKQIDRETDETKRKDLERQLSQVEQELRQKDNDTYRRQHSVFTDG